jgi:lipopolysaccharide export LptBFGC system permease protein LptF
MSEGMHVHGPHDHEVEHQAHSGPGLAQQVALFTAILATLGAIVSYQGGHSQNEALYYKNEAVLQKADASNQWAYYQAKSTKQNLAELAERLTNDAEKKAFYAGEVKRYKAEKDEIMVEAKKFEKLSDDANKKSEHALHPHDKLAQAMTFIQIAISLASITVLTRRRWMFVGAGIAGAIGLGFWGLAFFSTAGI